MGNECWDSPPVEYDSYEWDDTDGSGHDCDGVPSQEQRAKDAGLSFILDMVECIPSECKDCPELFSCGQALMATIRGLDEDCR